MNVKVNVRNEMIRVLAKMTISGVSIRLIVNVIKHTGCKVDEYLDIKNYQKSKNHTYYFFNDVISVKTFDPNKIKTKEKSYKSILIYYIGYVRVK